MLLIYTSAHTINQNELIFMLSGYTSSYSTFMFSVLNSDHRLAGTILLLLQHKNAAIMQLMIKKHQVGVLLHFSQENNPEQI